MSIKQAAIKLPVVARGEVNAFFGLFINLLVNVADRSRSGDRRWCTSRPQRHRDDPARAGNRAARREHLLFHAPGASGWRARRDATTSPRCRTARACRTCSSSRFVIMLPIYLKTNDPIQAWEAGLAWAFIIGVIILIGAFIGPVIRKITPRAALLGTLAGISITFIAMRPAAQMWEATWIALPVLASSSSASSPACGCPGNIPIGLAALLVGTAIGWIGGYMQCRDVSTAAQDIAVGLPDAEHRPAGRRAERDLAAAGHRDPARASTTSPRRCATSRAPLRPATRTTCAASCSPTAPARWSASASAARSRRRSTLGTRAGRRPADASATRWQPGSSSRCSASIGLFPLLAAVLPAAGDRPGSVLHRLVIGSQAFRVVPRATIRRSCSPMVPNLAAWAGGYDRQCAHRRRDVSAAQVGAAERSQASGVVYGGLTPSATGPCSPA